MTATATTDRWTTPEGIDGSADEPTVPPEAAARFAAAGMQVLATKLATRWTLVGTGAVVALVVAAVVIRRWRGAHRAEG